MNGIGEAIYGHCGEYKMCCYGSASREQVQNFFFSKTQPGENAICNQVIVLGSSQAPSFLWSTFSLRKNDDSVAGTYIHSVYEENNLQNLWDISRLIRFPFMNVDECIYYLKNADQFTSRAGVSENTGQEDQRQKKIPDIELPDELLVKIVCYCIKNIQIKNKNYLCILVPADEADYHSYCLAVIERLIKVIPVGFRKNISIATNPDPEDENNFGIIFKRKGEIEQEKGVLLSSGISYPFLEESFPSEDLTKVFSFCVKTPFFVEACYNQIESKQTGMLLAGTESPAADKYVDFYEEWVLEHGELDISLLKLFDKKIKQFQGEEKERIYSVLDSRIKKIEEVEGLLSKDAESQDLSDIHTILRWLGSYDGVLSHIIDSGNNKFSEAFTKLIFYRPVINENSQVFEYNLKKFSNEKRKLEEYFSMELIENIVSGQRQNLADIRKKELLKKIEQYPCLCNVKKNCEEFYRLAPEYMKSFSESVSEELLSIYPKENLTEELLEKLAAYEIGKILHILRDYQGNGAYGSSFIKFQQWCMGIYLPYLINMGMEIPRFIFLREALSVADESQGSGVILDSIFKFTNEVITDEIERIKKENKSDSEIIKNLLIIKPELTNRMTGDKCAKEKRKLINQIDELLNMHINYYLQNLKNIMELTEVLWLVKEINDGSISEDLNKNICNRILIYLIKNYKADDKGDKEIEQIFDMIEKTKVSSEELNLWKEYVKNKDALNDEFCNICKKIDTWEKYLFRCRKNFVEWHMTTDGLNKLKLRLTKKHNKNTYVTIDFFVASISSIEGKLLPDVFRDEIARLIYCDIFNNLYSIERRYNPIGIRVMKGRTAAEIYQDVLNFEYMLNVCGKKNSYIYVYGKREEKAFLPMDLKNSLKFILNSQNGVQEDSENSIACINDNCIDFLEKQCGFFKKNIMKRTFL